MSSPAIAIRGLRRRFGEVEALRGVDLEVPGPGVYGFLGVNGAGKTTTLRILAGLIHPGAGQVEIFGRPVQDPTVRRRIGYLPQDPAFYPWMRGRELLHYAGQLLGLDRDTTRRRATELLERLELGDAGTRRIGGYSGGMLQRLGIAQALMSEPDLLLLDEPVSALDPLGRMAMLELLEQLGRERTVFFSSHILADVERVCHEVTILHGGQVRIRETTQALRERFLLPVFNLVLEAEVEGLAEGLRAEGWVEELSEEPAGDAGWQLRIRARDAELAQRRIPALLAERGAALQSFGRHAPSLEEVFVQLVQSTGNEETE